MRFTFSGLLSGADESSTGYKGEIQLSGRRGVTITGATLMSPTQHTDFVLDFGDSDHHELLLSEVKKLMVGENVRGFVASKTSQLALFAWLHQKGHL